jgi:hypothetical protein
MSAIEEETRAAAYREQLCSRRAYTLQRERALHGSTLARKELDANWKPLMPKEYRDAEQQVRECEPTD